MIKVHTNSLGKYLSLIIFFVTATLMLTSCIKQPEEPIVTKIDENVTMITTKEDVTYKFFDGSLGIKLPKNSKYDMTEPYTLQEIQGKLHAGDIVFEFVQKDKQSIRYSAVVRKNDYLLGYNAIFRGPEGSISVDADQNQSDEITRNIQFIYRNELQDSKNILDKYQSCVVLTPLDETTVNIAVLHVYPVDIPYYNIVNKNGLNMILSNNKEFNTPADELFKPCNIDITNKNATYSIANVFMNGSSFEQIKKDVENFEYDAEYNIPFTEPFKITNIQEGKNIAKADNKQEIQTFPTELNYELDGFGKRIYKLSDKKYNFFEMKIPDDIGNQIFVGEYSNFGVFGIYYRSEKDPNEIEDMYEYIIGEGLNSASSCCDSGIYTSNLVYQFKNNYRIVEKQSISMDLFDKTDIQNYYAATEYLKDKITFTEQ